MIPQEAYRHCLEYGRNEELEKIILTDSTWAYFYAMYVIKDRWPEAELIIATDSDYAYNYAVDLIKGKLPELMHNVMLLHADHNSKAYLEFINN